jgi:hypothetical protein
MQNAKFSLQNEKAEEYPPRVMHFAPLHFALIILH